MSKKRKSAEAPQSGKKKAAPSLWPKVAVITAVLVVGLGAGILGWTLFRDGSSGDTNTIAKIKLPSFVYQPGVPQGTAKAYQAALDIPDDLAQIPCYCGCGMEAGHQNNLDCFIKSRNGGNVAWDSHAAGWDLWVQIALEVVQLKQQGLPLKEIRAKIDAKYKALGYKPTPTPPVKE